MSSSIKMQIFRFNKYLYKVQQKNHELQSLSLTQNSLLFRHYFVSFEVSYKYLLNLNICMLIEYNMNYPLIFFINVFIVLFGYFLVWQYGST
jgi:hypothetical protein